MSGKSDIEWTGSTWNPIKARLRAHTLAPTKANPLRIVPAGTVGYHCERVSPGCKRCYACAGNGRTLPSWGTGLDYTVPNRDKVEIFLDEKEMLVPEHWRAARTVFVCSMTDLFADFVPDAFIDRMMGRMSWWRRHTFQILTKRSERMMEYSRELAAMTSQQRAFRMAKAMGWDVKGWESEDVTGNMDWPLPNCWLGVSIENRANKYRMQELAETPAAVRFLSLEPLLEDLGALDLTDIDWVIVGGESGPGARPCDLAWIRSIVAQCKAAGVPCFVKQLGAHIVASDNTAFGWPINTVPGLSSDCSVDPPRIRVPDKKGGNPEEWPPYLRVRQMPEVKR
jgi:protein gp37